MEAAAVAAAAAAAALRLLLSYTSKREGNSEREPGAEDMVKANQGEFRRNDNLQ